MHKFVLTLGLTVSGGSGEFCSSTNVYQTVVYSDLKDVLFHITSLVDIDEKDKSTVKCRLYDYIAVECREIVFTDNTIINEFEWKCSEGFDHFGNTTCKEFNAFLGTIRDNFNKMIRGE